MMLFKTDIISKLENYIEKYEKIFIINFDSQDNNHILKRICKTISNMSKRHNFIICSENDFELERLNNIDYWSQEEMSEFLKLYLIYEFSDKIILLSDTTQYPSISNYIFTGLLTEELCCEALIY